MERYIVDAADSGMRLVYYHLLSVVTEQAPDALVAFIRVGVHHPLTAVANILASAGNLIDPETLRKFFHFQDGEHNPAASV